MKHTASGSSTPSAWSDKSTESVDETIGVFRISSIKEGVTRREFLTFSLVSAAALLVSCNTRNQLPSGNPDTPMPPTRTPVPPTDTPIPSTNTPIPPTNTPIPPTDTPIPPTSSDGQVTFSTFETTVPGEFGSGIGLRTAGTSQSQTIVILPSSLPITIIGRSENNQWLEVQLSNGITGWVSAIYFKSRLETSNKIEELIVSNRTASVPAVLLSPDGDPNELVENVAQEMIQSLAEEAIGAVVDTVNDNLPSGSGSGSTLILPCLPGAVPPGYICTCNCV